jgi:MoaA/NifB/PqqE/SkfB family radical SAM enzyme
MIEAATRLGMGTNLTTNGLLLPARYAELRASGLHSLGVSIDGIGATHDALRGQEGAFDAAFRAIQFVSERGEIGLAVNMTVTATNVGEILAVWELANRHGASFDLWPVQDAPSLALSSPSHAEAWRQAIERLGVLDPAIEERRAYLLGALTGGGGAVRCLGLVDQYGVLWDGSLLPCCQWGRRGLVVGNVFETPLHELWRGPEALALRHRIFTEGCGGACYNHSLHLFQRSTGLDFHVTP